MKRASSGTLLSAGSTRSDERTGERGPNGLSLWNAKSKGSIGGHESNVKSAMLLYCFCSWRLSDPSFQASSGLGHFCSTLWEKAQLLTGLPIGSTASVE